MFQLFQLFLFVSIDRDEPPPGKDDTQNREAFHIFLQFSNLNWKTFITDHILIILNWQPSEKLIGEIKHFHVTLTFS